MRTRPFLEMLILCSFAALPLASAKEPPHSAIVRDGSSFERAIIPAADYDHYVDWEWDYLKKRLWGQGMPVEHALTEHNGRLFDVHTFSTSQGNKVIYFDITRFADRLKRKHTHN